MRKWYDKGFYSAEDDHTGLILVLVESQIECFVGEEEACHIEILKKESRYQWAAVLFPHNGYADMRKQYYNVLYSAEDDHTGLILVLVESQIECFIGEEEVCHVEILKK